MPRLPSDTVTFLFTDNEARRHRCTGPRCCSRGQCNSNVQPDADNCGRCGLACPNGQTCCSGTCRNLPTDEDTRGAYGDCLDLQDNRGLG